MLAITKVPLVTYWQNMSSFFSLPLLAGFVLHDLADSPLQSHAKRSEEKRQGARERCNFYSGYYVPSQPLIQKMEKPQDL